MKIISAILDLLTKIHDQSINTFFFKSVFQTQQRQSSSTDNYFSVSNLITGSLFDIVQSSCYQLLLSVNAVARLSLVHVSVCRMHFVTSVARKWIGFHLAFVVITGSDHFI